MKFCPKCGSILLPKEEKGKKIIACSCGYKEKAEGEISIREKTQSKIEAEMGVVDEMGDVKSLPIAEEEKCPKCGNMGAYYFLQQTRSADEGETRFFRCVKCDHTWREY